MGSEDDNRKRITSALLAVVLLMVVAVLCVSIPASHHDGGMPTIPDDGDGAGWVVSDTRLPNGVNLCMMQDGVLIPVAGPVFDRGTFGYGSDKSSVDGVTDVMYRWDPGTMDMSRDDLFLCISGIQDIAVGMRVTVEETNTQGIFHFSSFELGYGDGTVAIERTGIHGTTAVSECTFTVHAGAVPLSMSGIIEAATGPMPEGGLERSVLTVTFSIAGLS